MSRKLVTITGPSASGKTELVKTLIDKYGFSKLISSTTRPKREGEVEGSDYYFVSEDQFKEYLNSNGLTQSVCFNGKYYGTTVNELERVFALGEIPVVIVEPGGVTQFKELEEKLNIEVFPVFISAPYEVLRARFLGRARDKELSEYDKIRLGAIKKESDTWYSERPWSLVLNNPGSDLESMDWFSGLLIDCLEEKDVQ